MNDELPSLQEMNASELAHLIRRHHGLVVRRSVPRERLLQLIEEGQSPLPHEVAGTQETRKILEGFIEENKTWVESQIPCKGVNRGKCTVYPCPEGRHLDCYLSARPRIRLDKRSCP